MTNMEQMKELEQAAKAMNDAGYKNITVDMIEKSENQYGIDVYIAVVGDAMAVYTPRFRSRFSSYVSKSKKSFSCESRGRTFFNISLKLIKKLLNT